MQRHFMKYSQLRRGLSPEDAAAYVGSKELLRQFELAKWLKPFIRGNRLTRFRHSRFGWVHRPLESRRATSECEAGYRLPSKRNRFSAHRCRTTKTGVADVAFYCSILLI